METSLNTTTSQSGNNNLSSVNKHSPKLSLKEINSLFKNLYEKRETDYFDKKMIEGTSNTPLIHFLRTYCNCLLEDLINFKKVKTNSDNLYFLFVTKQNIILTKDYEDPCSINFCISKNPIILNFSIEHIENYNIKSDENKHTLTVQVSNEAQLKGGNLM